MFMSVWLDEDMQAPSDSIRTNTLLVHFMKRLIMKSTNIPLFNVSSYIKPYHCLNTTDEIFVRDQLLPSKHYI